MNIKVCGITTPHQLYEVAELNVQYAGFIFYPRSPRYVVNSELTGAEVKKAKLKLYKVGVFVDASYDEVMRKIDEYGLDMVQLHGHETPYQCNKILPHIDVIKAFRFAENDHVMWMLQDFYSSSDMFLLDTGIPAPKEERENKSLHGGIGRKFSWNRLQGLNIQKPYFLSGGIEPTDAASIKMFMNNFAAKDMIAVDINSRFESSPGIKDMAKVKRFINELNGHVSYTSDSIKS